MPFRKFPMKSSGLFAAPPKPDSYIIAHTDGGARGNPGPAGYGVFITGNKGQKLEQLSQYLGEQTNNYAEYSGLLAALEWSVTNGQKNVQVVSDSELMVKQLRGEYKVRNENLQPLYEKAQRLISQLDWFEVRHVLRGQNKEADALANAAMDKGSGRSTAAAPVQPASGVLHGVVRSGKIELLNGELPEGTKVLVRKA